VFEKLAKTPKKTRSTPTLEVPETTAFLTCVRDAGFRLSYGALAEAANQLGEDTSRQIRAQRGSKIVQSMPVALQPYVCRKAGGYRKGVTWDVETPKDLTDRPVIIEENVADAIAEWRDAQAKAAKEAAEASDA
jgi:hypothetical protein